jgi:hypothetical protein
MARKIARSAARMAALREEYETLRVSRAALAISGRR